MRLFVAAYPPEHVLDDLQHTADRLHIASGPRVNDRSLWHITLAFLGEVDEDQAPAIARAVDRAAEETKPSLLRLAGGGRFGQAHRTIIYAGVAGDVASLGRTATTIRRELDAIGISYDQRRFAPHLTLARPGARVPEAQLAEDLATLSAYRGPQWTADAILVVASHEGSPRRYAPIHRAGIAATQPRAPAAGHSS